MTLEDFAVAIQRDYLSLRKDVAAGFAEVRAEMATKRELRALQGEMRIGFKNLNDLYGRQIHDLQTRVDVLEGKLGIKPLRRAA